MESYRVRVTKDYLSFASAHFIVFQGSQCERLHGHNYRVAAELEADLDPDHLVFDFIALKKMLRSITDELDHRLLVPLESQKLRIGVGERQVSIVHGDKEWIVPRGDCALLPLANTTAELLARLVAERLLAELRRAGGISGLRRVEIEVEESPGQSAVYRRDFPAGGAR